MTRLNRYRYAIVAAAAAGSLSLVVCEHQSRKSHHELATATRQGSEVTTEADVQDARPPSLLSIPQNVQRVAAEFDGPPLPGGASRPVQAESLKLEREIQDRPLVDAFPRVDEPRAAPARVQERTEPRAGGSDEKQDIPTFRIGEPTRPSEAEQPLESAPVPPATATMHRSPAFDRAMAAVSQQADAHTADGFRLASKGAFFAARAEMIQALRLIAQALDAHSAEEAHSQSLAAGLRALKEAADFAPRGARLEADLDIASIAAAHQTPVINGAGGGKLSALAARQAYYTYAQERLAFAAGGASAGSNALYGLGRIHQALADSDAEAVDLNQPAAMVCHQAALIVEPRNYMAANELGVLLARSGQLEGAKKLLQISLRSHSQAAAWRNLAAVEALRGDQELSRQAAREAALLARNARPEQAATGNIQWVKPNEFARQNDRETQGPAIGAPRSRGLR